MLDNDKDQLKGKFKKKFIKWLPNQKEMVAKKMAEAQKAAKEWQVFFLRLQNPLQKNV